MDDGIGTHRWNRRLYRGTDCIRPDATHQVLSLNTFALKCLNESTVPPGNASTRRQRRGIQEFLEQRNFWTEILSRLDLEAVEEQRVVVDSPAGRGSALI